MDFKSAKDLFQDRAETTKSHKNVQKSSGTSSDFRRDKDAFKTFLNSDRTQLKTREESVKRTPNSSVSSTDFRSAKNVFKDLLNKGADSKNQNKFSLKTRSKPSTEYKENILHSSGSTSEIEGSSHNYFSEQRHNDFKDTNMVVAPEKPKFDVPVSTIKDSVPVTRPKSWKVKPSSSKNPVRRGKNKKKKKLVTGQKFLSQFFNSSSRDGNRSGENSFESNKRVQCNNETDKGNVKLNEAKPCSIFQGGILSCEGIESVVGTKNQRIFCPSNFVPRVGGVLTASSFVGSSPSAAVIPTWLVGRNFHQNEAFDPDREDKSFQQVKLVREPENRYDTNAIMVFNFEGDQIGHVEGSTAAIVSPLLDSGRAMVHAQLDLPVSLNDPRFPLYVILVFEGECESQVIESALTLSHTRCSKDFFSALTKRKQLMAKKDSIELSKKSKRLKWQQKTLTGPILVKSDQQFAGATASDCWDRLCDNLLKRIFMCGALSLRDFINIMLVSKRWNQVINDPSFLKYQFQYYSPDVSVVGNWTFFDEIVKDVNCRFGYWLTDRVANKLIGGGSLSNHKNMNGTVLLLRALFFSGVRKRRQLIQKVIPRLGMAGFLDEFNISRHEIFEFLFFILCTLKMKESNAISSYHHWSNLRNEMEQFILLAQTCPSQTFPNGQNATWKLKSTNQSVQLDGGGNSKKPKRKLTGEQLRAVRTTLKDGEVLKIRALAGTGKTTTLLEYARARPGIRILYLAFNVSVREEAAKVFPSNVDCKNVNQLAFGKMKIFRYQKANQFVPNLDERRLLNLFLDKTAKSSICGDQDIFFNLRKCSLVSRCLDCYLRSSHKSISMEKHVGPPTIKFYASAVRDGYKKSEKRDNTDCDSPSLRNELFLLVKGLWRCMKSLKEEKVPLTHDGYLKLYQLSEPDLTKVYDVIMLDEAQDANPCTRDIVMRQRCARILVGDENQAIYGFLGAEDALSDENVHATYSIELTRSFRFGPNIAAIANKVLTTWRSSNNEKRKILLGGSMNNDGLVCCPRHSLDNGHNAPDGDLAHRTLMEELISLLKSKIREKVTGTLCLVSRSNSYLWMYIFELLDLSLPASIGFVGGIEKSGVEIIEDCAYLAYGEKNKIRSKFLKSMSSFQQLEAFAKAVNSQDWLWKIGLVNKFRGHDIIRYCTKLRQSCVGTSDAHVVFSTVHSAKGLEFDHVLLAEDFPQLARLSIDNEIIPSVDGIPNLDGWFVEEENGVRFVGAGSFRTHVTFNCDADRFDLKQEINALYVACTRAKKILRLNKSLTDILAITHGLDTITTEVTTRECDYCFNGPAVTNQRTYSEKKQNHVIEQIGLEDPVTGTMATRSMCSVCLENALDKETLQILNSK